VTETRLDFARFATSKIQRTPQGGMRLDARVTRVGIFPYKRQDGTIVRELRPADEVFKADSLATLADATVTVFHPSKLVDPTSYRQDSVGHVSGSARVDGDFVAAVLVVQDSKAVEDIAAGRLRETSCGYTCTVDKTAGIYKGERYDQVQRNIRYNHVAVIPRGTGRAGPDVCLRVDSSDESPRFDAVQVAAEEDMNETEVKNDGAAIATLVAERAALQSQKDELQGRFDAQSKELEAVRAELATATSAATIQARVDSRIALELKAREVLGADARFDGKNDREVMASVLLKADTELKLDGLSDDYVRGGFEQALKRPVRSDSLAETRKAVVSAATEERSDSQTSRQKMIEANRNAWKREGN
jgi:uncharacterized protein